MESPRILRAIAASQRPSVPTIRAMAGRPAAGVLFACALASALAGTGSASAGEVRVTAPAAVLDLLPPGIRPAAERAKLAFTRRASDDAPRRLLELLEPEAGDAAGDWLEVEYSVDPDLDERVRGVLERAGVPLGHVILMDPATGEVFSYVSTDPDTFPATRPYPAASLVKVVTAAAMLRTDPEHARHPCRYLGSPYQLVAAQLRPPDAGGREDPFWRAMASSNNQCFARYAVHDVGAEALLDEMSRVGMLDAPGAHHAAGRIGPVRSELELGQLGSGLAGSFITPLAAVRLAAILAEGELVQPYWIARVRDARGAPLAVPGHEAPQRVWSRELADELREVTVQVTTQGTASRGFRNARGEPLLGPVRVAGKTGTLSGTQPPGRYQWFIGVAPANAPRLAIAAVVVHGAPGGASAAYVAARTLQEIFCDGDACDPSGAEKIHARARTRDDEARREWDRTRAERRAREELDRPPRPVTVTPFDFPRALRERGVQGEIVLLVDLDRDGRVLDVEVESSDLPAFEPYVLREVRGWSFTQPTAQGRPVEARARLPIPIHIR